MPGKNKREKMTLDAERMQTARERFLKSTKVGFGCAREGCVLDFFNTVPLWCCLLLQSIYWELFEVGFLDRGNVNLLVRAAETAEDKIKKDASIPLYVASQNPSALLLLLMLLSPAWATTQVRLDRVVGEFCEATFLCAHAQPPAAVWGVRHGAASPVALVGPSPCWQGGQRAGRFCGCPSQGSVG
jgi:hypothetical protein